MNEETPSKSKVPHNPLLKLDRGIGFIRMIKEDCVYYLHTDLWRFNGVPSESDSTIIVTSRPYAVRPEERDDYKVDIVDDKRRILGRSERWAPTEEADNVILEGPSEFCGACYSALGYLVGRLAESDEKETETKEDQDKGTESERGRRRRREERRGRWRRVGRRRRIIRMARGTRSNGRPAKDVRRTPLEYDGLAPRISIWMSSLQDFVDTLLQYH